VVLWCWCWCCWWLVMQCKAPDTVEDWEHPLFMTALPEADHPEVGVLDALSSLIYDDKTPEQLAEHFKNQGNEMVKAGPKYYKDALTYYTQALDQKSSLALNNSIYYSNRAAVHLMLRDYNATVADCMAAIECNPRNIKAYIRAAKACNALGRWEEALEFCKGGLEEEPGKKELVAQEKKASEIRAKTEQREREKREEQERRQAEDKNILVLLHKKGIQMGKACFNTQAYIDEGPDGKGPALSKFIFVGPSDQLSMSVLFIYEEYKQTDFIKEFNLNETFIDHLAMMFPSLVYTPVSESGETINIAPSPWDEKKDYLVENLLIYYETDWTEPLSGAKARKRQKGEQKVKIDPSWTLDRILRDPRYVIPGLPVFYIIPSRLASAFLQKT